MADRSPNLHDNVTPVSQDTLSAAQSALTAVGEQYATSNGLSYEDRQDLHDQVVDAAAVVKKLTGGTE
jgi:hypothetical protein